MTLNGLDVSAYQPANITSFIPGDLEYIKEPEETDEVDPQCDPARDAARTVSQLMGIYHFAQQVNATAETDCFLTNITGYVPTAALDMDLDTTVVESRSISDTSWMDRVSVEAPPRSKYQSHDISSGRWQPHVIGTNGYAGVIGQEMDALACDATSYRVHVLGGQWLTEATQFRIYDQDNGMAGILGQAIDGVSIQGKTYRVHTVGGSWLGWVTQDEDSDWVDGMAGIPGRAIDAIQIQ
ncbi:MAG: hypothetical protein FWF25_00875 [Propionibacteriaceae bacterium]|nr:hypothetical protein [Propionibacteriaceae bacterium]